MRLFDRVRETTDTVGTGPFALLGADGASMREFGDVLADGEQTLIAAALGAQWEIALAKYNVSGNTLTRIVVYANSLGTKDFMDFDAGTKKVWIDHPAMLDLAASGMHLCLAQGGIGILP